MTDQTMRPLPLAQAGGLTLRYGENAWQGAQLFTQFSDDPLELGKFVLEAGELPSATNLTDLDRGIHALTHAVAALECNEAPERDVAFALKHGNPCGAAYSQSRYVTLKKMIDGDLQAIMGAAVVCNFEIDAEAADVLLNYKSPSGKRLFDLIAADNFTPNAVEMLDWRKAGKCRLMSNSALTGIRAANLNTSLKARGVRQGHIVQDADNRVLNFNDPALKVYGQPYDRHIDDLAFASAICRTSNSNTVTLVHNGMLIGQGTGQTRRDRAARLAIMIAFENGHYETVSPFNKKRLPRGTVVCSDSFFPFADGVEPLIKNGAKVIFSTSGALRDSEVQEACIAAGVTLYQLPDKDARMFFGH